MTLAGFLSGLALYVGLFLGSLSLAEFVLTDIQKKYIVDFMITSYIKLDDIRKHSVFTRLKSHKSQIFLSATVQLSASILLIYVGLFNIKSLIILILTFSIWVSPAIFRWIVDSKWMMTYILKSILASVPIYILSLLMFIFRSPVLDSPIYSLYIKDNIFHSHVIQTLPVFLVLLPIMIQIVYSFVIFFISLLAHVILFLLRRLVDNPKGVFGLSGLLTGIGAIVKFYLGKT